MAAMASTADKPNVGRSWRHHANEICNRDRGSRNDWARQPAGVCLLGRRGTPATWVSGAEVILRARAVEERGSRIRGNVQESRAWYDATGRRLGTTVTFEVLEVLKGQTPGTAIELEGELTERDDFND